MLQAAVASLGLVCYVELLFTNVHQRPYAYPFSRIVWCNGGILLLVMAGLWMHTLLHQEKRLKPALCSLGAGIPVFFLGMLVWPALWTLVSSILPAVEAIF